MLFSILIGSFMKQNNGQVTTANAKSLGSTPHSIFGLNSILAKKNVFAEPICQNYICAEWNNDWRKNK